MRPSKTELISSIRRCALSYCENYIKSTYLSIHKQSKKPWFKPWKWYDEFVYFRTEENGIVDITIRGTEGLGPWIDNCDPFPISGGLYDGFVDGAQILYGSLYVIMNEYPEKTKFRLNAHSRGVPIAAILAFWLSTTFYIHSVLCWDGPVFSTKEFNDKYNKILGDRTWYINMKNSAVANIMPRYIFKHKFERTDENHVILLDNGKNSVLDSFTNHKPLELLKAVFNCLN